MTDTAFQFSGTQAIAQQIAQLQEQLNKHQECEQKAEELRLTVAEFGHEMTAKGIPQDDIFLWAKSLYSAASNTEFVDSDSSLIAAQNQVIAELKAELTTAQKRCDQAQEERQNALALLENTTAQRDKSLTVTATIGENTISEQITDTLKVNPSLSGKQIIEALGMDKEERGIYTHLNRLVDKGIIFCDADPLDKRRKLYSLYDARGLANATLSENNTQHDTQCLENNTQHDTFNLGDRVAVVDIDEDEDLRYLLEFSGIVVGVDGDSIAVFFEKRLEFDEREVVMRSRYLNYMELTPSEIELLPVEVAA